MFSSIFLHASHRTRFLFLLQYFCLFRILLLSFCILLLSFCILLLSFCILLLNFRILLLPLRIYTIRCAVYSFRSAFLFCIFAFSCIFLHLPARLLRSNSKVRESWEESREHGFEREGSVLRPSYLTLRGFVSPFSTSSGPR